MLPTLKPSPDVIAEYFAAIRRKDTAQLRRYLDTVPDIATVQEAGTNCTGLHIACALNDTRAMGLLLRAGARLDAMDIFHDTPLYTAVRAGHTKAVRMLLDAGQRPDPDDLTTAKVTLLHIAAREGDCATATVLLAAGAALEARTHYCDWTPVHCAIIGHGSFDYMREGPVHMFCTQQMRMLSLLLRHGANPNAQDWQGATPLHHAVIVHCARLLRLLIRHGAEITAEDNAGRTPLACAQQRGYEEIVTVLDR